MQVRWTNPRKLATCRSYRITKRRSLRNHANSRSIFHRRLYLRSGRPSCVLCLRPFRCGAIRATPVSASASSSASLSYALSPMSSCGCSDTNVESADGTFGMMGSGPANHAIEPRCAAPTEWHSTPHADHAMVNYARRPAVVVQE